MDSSFEKRDPKDLRTSRRSQRQKNRQGAGLGFPSYRVLSFCLGLLDTALLIAALVLGMYCAKAKDFDVSDPTLGPLIMERDFLRNHSDATIKESQAVRVELENQRRTQLELQVRIKQQQTVTDRLQSHIQAMKMEKSLLESNITSLEVSCGKCPVGWILLKTSCYFFSSNPSNIKKNWPDSRADCISRGGDLLVINNLEEQKAINNNLPKITGTGVQWKTGFWIGLTDSATNGVWVWVNNVAENNTMYWQTGQPNTESSSDAHCAAFARNIVSWRSWYNRNCQNDALNWICETKPR